MSEGEMSDEIDAEIIALFNRLDAPARERAIEYIRSLSSAPTEQVQSLSLDNPDSFLSS